YPGVTETETYATFGGDVGLNIHVGKHARFRALGGLSLEMPHFITFGTANLPSYRQIIDQPGRRFRVEGTQIWSLLVEGSIMFYPPMERGDALPPEIYRLDAHRLPRAQGRARRRASLALAVVAAAATWIAARDETTLRAALDEALAVVT